MPSSQTLSLLTTRPKELCFLFKKRDKNKEELEKKKEFIHEMRNKTIDRLKEFKKVTKA